MRIEGEQIILDGTSGADPQMAKLPNYFEGLNRFEMEKLLRTADYVFPKRLRKEKEEMERKLQMFFPFAMEQPEFKIKIRVKRFRHKRIVWN